MIKMLEVYFLHASSLSCSCWFYQAGYSLSFTGCVIDAFVKVNSSESNFVVTLWDSLTQ